MSLFKNGSKRWVTRLFSIAGMALAGCSNGTTTLVVPLPSAPIGLPAPAAPGNVNTYFGAQSPGAWGLTLDNSKDVYNFAAITYPAEGGAASAGSLEKVNGFIRLGATGYALEVEGRAALLRPGDATAPIVFSVPQTQCYAITGRLRFQFIGMETAPDGVVGSAGPTNGYGSMVASTDTTGASWQFEDLQGNVVNGPGMFTGTCSTTGTQSGIQLSGQTVLNDLWPPNQEIQESLPTEATSTIWIGPSGFLVGDQSVSNSTTPAGSSIAGLAEPTQALLNSDMNSHAYLGFLYEPATTPYLGVAPSSPLTSPVSFGQVVPSSTNLTGGVFPNDDVTQQPNADTVITLGKQDGSINGLFPSVSITVSDPAQNCANYTGSGESATSGTNLEGYYTCTFSGVAIAGNPEGKYAIFITAYNWAAQLGGAPMQLYLFQQ